DAQHGRFATARGAEDGHEVVVVDMKVHRQQRLRGLPLGRSEGARDTLNGKLAHYRELQANRRRLTALNSESDTRPIRPMTRMPKMIWPVLSNAWLSVIMWPMPDEEPISSATMT